LVKRLELLKELLPGLSRVAVLQSKAEMTVGWEQSQEAAARQLGIKVLLAEHTPTDYAAAFALIARERADALSVAISGANFANRHLIIEFSAKNRLPAIYGAREFATARWRNSQAERLAGLEIDDQLELSRLLNR